MPRRNITTDDEIEDWFADHPDINASRLIRDLLHEYMTTDTIPQAVAEKRRNAIEARIQAYKDELDAARDELDDVTVGGVTTDGVTAYESLSEDLRWSLDACADLPANRRTPDNPAIQTQAGKANVPAGYFIDLLDEHFPADRDAGKVNLRGGATDP